MGKRATGSFDVKFEALDSEDPLGRRRIHKTITGDLVGTGWGEMMSIGSPDGKWAAYVALDVITGTVDGRTGSFVLKHNGTMARGAGSLHVAIVPDSGSGDLKGISGEFIIDARDGHHYYTLDYEIEA